MAVRGQMLTGGRNQRRQPYQNPNEGLRGRKNKNPYSDEDPEEPDYADFRQGHGSNDPEDDRKRQSDTFIKKNFFLRH